MIKNRKRKRFTVKWVKSEQCWETFGRRRFRNKERTIEVAKQEAKMYALSQLVIFKKNGQIQTEYTYGKDPRRTPG